MRGEMECYGLSDKGKLRDSNDDQFLIADLYKSMRVHQTSLCMDDQTRLFGTSQGTLLVVADGVQGSAPGYRASLLAVDSLTAHVLNNMHWFFQLHEDSENDFFDDLVSAMEHCQDRISYEGEIIPSHQGMATRIILAYIVWPRMYVVHVGDGRCYLHRNSTLQQVTRDHTVAQQFVESGVLDPQDAEKSRWSDVVWNTVGGSSNELSPEVYKANIKIGDTVLLCTDGLHKHLADMQIMQVLNAHDSAEEACRSLVEAAKEAGGSDNITTIIARFRKHNEQNEAVQVEVEQGVMPTRIDTDIKTKIISLDNLQETRQVRESQSNIRNPLPGTRDLLRS